MAAIHLRKPSGRGILILLFAALGHDKGRVNKALVSMVKGYGGIVSPWEDGGEACLPELTRSLVAYYT